MSLRKLVIASILGLSLTAGLVMTQPVSAETIQPQSETTQQYDEPHLESTNTEEAPTAGAAHVETDTDHAETGHGAPLLLALAAILVAAKVFHLIEKIKQPPVVGELLAGIVLGNLVLLGFNGLEWTKTNEILAFMAELGVIILLFQIGLESNVKELLGVGWRAVAVALIGAAAPFLIGSFVLAPLLVQDVSLTAQLFLGASLAATSVGITARVFRDAGQMNSPAAKTFLSATIIDDNLGLILLAVVSAMASGGVVTPQFIGFSVLTAVGFLVGSVAIGQLAAPYLGKLFSKIHTGQGTKFTLALSLGLTFAYIAQLLGLEPIVGAFAAGLVLDPVDFDDFEDPYLVKKLKEIRPSLSKKNVAQLDSLIDHHIHKNIEELIEPLALFFVPLFFVITGMGVDLSVASSPRVIMLSLVVTVLAVITKMIAALPVEPGRRLKVGLAMVPRGEVGLIFASVGRGLGVLDQELFAVIVLSVLLTTIIGPFGLSAQLRKEKAAKSSKASKKTKKTKKSSATKKAKKTTRSTKRQSATKKSKSTTAAKTKSAKKN